MTDITLIVGVACVLALRALFHGAALWTFAHPRKVEISALQAWFACCANLVLAITLLTAALT